MCICKTQDLAFSEPILSHLHELLQLIHVFSVNVVYSSSYLHSHLTTLFLLVVCL